VSSPALTLNKSFKSDVIVRPTALSGKEKMKPPLKFVSTLPSQHRRTPAGRKEREQFGGEILAAKIGV